MIPGVTYCSSKWLPLVRGGSTPTLWCLGLWIASLLGCGVERSISDGPTGTDAVGSAVSEWERVDAGDWDAERLADVVELARRTRAVAFVLLEHGRVVVDAQWPVVDERFDRTERAAAEKYILGATDDERVLFEVTSIEKGILALLYVMVDTDDPMPLGAPIAELVEKRQLRGKDADLDGVTLEHVLAMTTGLDLRLERIAAPGERWYYNPYMPQLLFELLESRSGVDRGELLADGLARPLDLQSTRWRDYADEDYVGLQSTALDLARIGALFADGGVHAGEVLVTPDAMQRLVTPMTPLNPAMGLYWWLNRPGAPLQMEGGRLDRRPLPRAPEDMVMSMATNGHLMVSPERGLVLVRLGGPVNGPADETGKELPTIDRLWAMILAAQGEVEVSR